MKIKPIILAGGNGQRLLPFLKYNSPKQFLNILRGKGTLLKNTLNRFQNKELFDRPIIIGNIQHRDKFIKSIKNTKCNIDKLILEHEGRNTGPAIASATVDLQDNTLMLIVPIDHYIENEEKFLNKIHNVAKFVYENSHKIVTLFVKKTSTESNYGHLQLGRQVCDNNINAFEVTNFIEKHKDDTIESGLVWNSGIYCMMSHTCKKVFMKNAPYIWKYSEKAVLRGNQRIINHINEFILNHTYFQKNLKLSFDEILTMPYDPEILVSTDIGTHWEDVGIFSGIKRLYQNPIYSKIINKGIFSNIKN